MLELGDMRVVGSPPAKLVKALAVVADTLHPAYEANPRIIPGISKESCVLCSLTVRDFLRSIGFSRAAVASVCTIMAAFQDGKELHSLGCGVPGTPDGGDGRWCGHMVVRVGRMIIDTTLFHMQRPQWPDLPGMMAVPLLPSERRRVDGMPVLAEMVLSDDERPGYAFEIIWLDNSRNRSWREGGDAERERRADAVRALVERFGKWRR